MRILFLYITSILVLVFQPISAQDLNLTPDALAQYNKGKITIEIKRGITRINQKEFVPNKSPGARRWQAYLGLSPISEEQFYRLMKNDEALRNLSKYRSNTGIYLITGLAFIGAGAAFVLTAASQALSDDAQFLAITGAGCAGVGLGCLSISIYRGTRNANNYGFANDLAESYNQKLIIRLKKKF